MTSVGTHQFAAGWTAKIRAGIQAVACCALALLALSGCPGVRGATETSKHRGKESAGENQPVDAATIAYIGNFRGFQRPCGCDERQDGGLLRLATVLSVLRGDTLAAEALLSTAQLPAAAAEPQSPAAAAADRDATTAGNPALPIEAPAGAVLEPLWLIDCGNFSDGGNRLPGFRAATHLQALQHLGARAAVLGRAEAGLDRDQALAAFMNSPVPLVSCNVQCQLAEVEILPRLELAPGWYLLGLTEHAGGDDGGFASGGMALRRRLSGSQDKQTETGWCEVSDPLEALKAQMTQLPPGARSIVACAQLPAGLLAQIEALGPTVLIGAQHEADFRARQETLALPAVLEGPVRRGLLASFVSVKAPEDAQKSAPLDDTAEATFWTYRLATGIRDDPAMDALLKERDKESTTVALNRGHWKETKWDQDESFLPPEMRSKGSIVEGYVGSTVCRDCHPAEHQTWEGSGHQHAFQTLVSHDNSGTLDCLECHVTGLLEPGGFLPASAQADLAAVGCESCHGPGGEHVGLAQRLDASILTPEAIKAGKLPVMADKAIVRGAVTDCQYCHDDFNSPDFRLETYWPKIQH